MNITSVQPSATDANVETLPKDLEAACRSLEEAFSTLVFRKMREAMVPTTSKGAAAFARETSQSMLDSQWAHLASQGEGLGLWRTLYRQLEPASVKSKGESADQNGTGRPFPEAAQRLGGGLSLSSPRSQGSGFPLAPTAAAGRQRPPPPEHRVKTRPCRAARR